MARRERASQLLLRLFSVSRTLPQKLLRCNEKSCEMLCQISIFWLNQYVLLSVSVSSSVVSRLWHYNESALHKYYHWSKAVNLLDASPAARP